MDSCLAEDRGASLAFENTSVQRYFNHTSGSWRASKGIYKRSRLVSSNFYGFPDVEEQETSLPRAHSGFDGTLLSSYFFTELEDMATQSSAGDALRSSGLVRSQSYPLEGFNSATGNCFVKAPWSTEGWLCKLSYKQPNSVKEVLLASCISKVDSNSTQCASPMMIDVPEHQQDVIPHDNQHVSLISSVKKPTCDSSSSSNWPVNMQELPPAVTENSVDNKRCAALHVEAKDVVQEEGLSMRVKAQSQPSHCMSARQHPLGSKVLACGRRREMEDTATVVPSFTTIPCGMLGMCSCINDPASNTASDLHFFGVYDGHGGSQASAYCKERLHFLLAEELKLLDIEENCDADLSEGWMLKWKKTLTNCFSKIDKEVGGVCPTELRNADGTGNSCTCCEDSIAPENVGTTAVVAVVGSDQIVVANCGDSRAVLSRGGKAIALSRDHKPEREDETIRIEAAGGSVICWDGYRVGGFLALSRAIGDRYLKRYVISDPEVTCVQREDEDEVLILASDGLWDVMSNDYACEVARKGLQAARKKRENRNFSRGEDPAAATAAALLVKIAFGRGSKDNISVVVVDLTG